MEQQQEQQLNADEIVIEKRRPVGLFGFSRRLYKDVPDLFDVLKKLMVKIKDAEEFEDSFYTYYAESSMNFGSKTADSSNSNAAASRSVQLPPLVMSKGDLNSTSMIMSEYSSFSTVDLSRKLNEPVRKYKSNHNISKSKRTNQSVDKNKNKATSNGVKWCKWIPKKELSGQAKLIILKDNTLHELSYHVADIDVLLEHYALDEEIANYMRLLEFAFENYLESKKLDMSEINSSDAFFKIISKSPIKFLLSESCHVYTILDVIKIYFDYIVQFVDGQNDSLEYLVVENDDYKRFHNTVIHTAVDLAGLEFISEQDQADRKLHDFFKFIQYQLDVACENLFVDRHHSERLVNRNVIKSYGLTTLDDESVFEVDLSVSGKANVYVVREKKILLIRNHLGDHEALAAKRNREYNADVICSFKGLMEYIFKYLLTQNPELRNKVNLKGYCFQVSSADPTLFHFRGFETRSFKMSDVITKFFQYLSASVSKVTHKNARKLIVTSKVNYDIFKNKILLGSIDQTGYNFLGQNVYDYDYQPNVDDKLEILFNKMRSVFNKNSMITEISEQDLIAPNLDPTDREETFTLEIASFDNVSVCATINNKFMYMKNHIGDIAELNHILVRMDNTKEKSDKKNAKKAMREDIQNFIKLIKFGYDHLSRFCTDEDISHFNSNYMRIKCRKPIKFTLENSPVEYTIEDLFVKYFKHMAQSVSQRTKQKASKVLLMLPLEYNIVQKSQIKLFIEKADIEVIKILNLSFMRIMSLEFEKKFQTPGKYIMIDMATKMLTLTLFEYRKVDDSSGAGGAAKANAAKLALKNVSDDARKVQLNLKKSSKFKILSTLQDQHFDASQLEEKIAAYLIGLVPKLGALAAKDPGLIRKCCRHIQEQFNERASNAIVDVDSKTRMVVDYEDFSRIINKYAAQSDQLIKLVLRENSLEFERDIVRVDYTCRIFSTLYGNYLKERHKKCEDRFNCIDGFNTHGIMDYLNDLEENSEHISGTLTHNIGFAIAGGIFDAHLRRNRPLPCASIKTYVTAFDYQTELLFPMYMGERPFIRYCVSLGQVRVKNIPRVKAGEVGIELTLYIDADEKLNVSAIENKARRLLPVEFEYNEISDMRNVQMILDAIHYKTEDNELEERVKDFKTLIKLVRMKYSKEFEIREDMNSFMNQLNGKKDVLSNQVMCELLDSLKSYVQKKNLKVVLK